MKNLTPHPAEAFANAPATEFTENPGELTKTLQTEPTAIFSVELTEALGEDIETLRAKNPVAALIQAVMFEQWLRFTFISEHEDPCVVAIPHQERLDLAQAYPAFATLLTRMDGQPVDANTALAAIMTFADAAFSVEMKQNILESPIFQSAVAHFQFWVHEQVEQLEAAPLPFATWLQLFAAHQRAAHAAHPARAHPIPPAHTPSETFLLTLSTEHAHAQN